MTPLSSTVLSTRDPAGIKDNNARMLSMMLISLRKQRHAVMGKSSNVGQTHFCTPKHT